MSSGDFAPWLIEGVAVVTGGGRGIGAAIAHRLARLGAFVVVADLDHQLASETAERIRSDGLAAAAATVDVSSEGSVEALAELALSHGRLLSWVNNAGVLSRSPLLELTVDAWDRTMAVNARGAFLGTRAAGRRMPSGSAIVNLASIASIVAMPASADYCASKAAVALLTKSAALELGPKGIRVNAVAPGRVLTPMTSDRLAIPEQLGWTLSRTPLHRVGTPDDIAGAVAFLCSAQASYVNGVLLPCDGGWTAAA